MFGYALYMSLPLTQLAQEWRVPEVIELDGDRLVYEYGRGSWKIGAHEEMLDRFYALAAGTDQEILEYALDYGVLRLCVHGRPKGWEHGWDSEVQKCGPRPIDWEANLNRYAEPLSGWRRLSRALAGLRDAASVIASGQHIERPLMNALNWLASGWMDTTAEIVERVGRPATGDAHDRFALSQTLDAVLADAVRVGCRYPPSAAKPDLHLKANGLADALALQTVLTITKGEKSYLCDGCGAVFVPERQPKHGQRKFCQTCRNNRVPQRLASRDAYKRKREEAR